ncbi:capsule assembly Wzi family protein [Neolewinella xylanilytica]|uniref:capsule assembly Wzi family protein n=1 Tax=Neolewinella xylanilytica TaxID=1514080 RepID=UPI0011B0C838|nr:capsule assembly Wzi family protein [Neolewinella xylanilytica]
MLRLLTPIFFLLFTSCLLAQGAPLPVNEEGYDLVQRLFNRYGYREFAAPAADFNLRPASRGDLVRLIKTYDTLYGADWSRVDRYRVDRFYQDNNEWLSLPAFDPGEDADRAPYFIGEGFAVAAESTPLYQRSDRPILGTFYETPAFLFQHNRPDFYIRANPILDFRYGKQANEEQDYFFNQRGLRLRAGIDDRFFLHFEILETQAGLPNYLVNYYRERMALPGAGFVKTEFSLDLANITRGYDYLNGAGYLSVDISRHVGARIGYGQHFIGDGERSMILSDFSNNYPFLELNWRIWKFHYRNLFAELTQGPVADLNNGIPLPKKYLAAHYLSVNIGKRLSLGLYEAVILSREDGFDLAYLNPVILYRTVEGSIGSPDNVLIGLTGNYRLPYRTTVYGQFVIDEFKYSELFVERRGWWANKWGYQVGLRHTDLAGIDQLDLVLERNQARPFMYTHDGPSSYTQVTMPLAHPLGANFTENLLGLDYRPLPRLHLSGRFYLIDQGESTEDRVIGDDVFLSSDLRPADKTYGNEIGQGVGYTNTIIQIRAGYEVKPNLWLEAEFFSRQKDSQSASRDLETTLLNAGIRWNVARRREAF